MIRYEVVPHVGVGPVKLGMSRDEVRRVMPGPFESFRKVEEDRHETDAFHGSGFQVFYGGDEPVAEYIELSRESGFAAIYGGVDILALPAEEAVALVSRDAALDPELSEEGCSYVFPELELSLWRPFDPGAEESDDEDASGEGYEFSTIGIGADGYYSNMLDLDDLDKDDDFDD